MKTILVSIALIIVSSSTTFARALNVGATSTLTKAPIEDFGSMIDDGVKTSKSTRQNVYSAAGFEGTANNQGQKVDALITPSEEIVSATETSDTDGALRAPSRAKVEKQSANNLDKEIRENNLPAPKDI